MEFKSKNFVYLGKLTDFVNKQSNESPDFRVVSVSSHGNSANLTYILFYWDAK